MYYVSYLYIFIYVCMYTWYNVCVSVWMCLFLGGGRDSIKGEAGECGVEHWRWNKQQIVQIATMVIEGWWIFPHSNFNFFHLSSPLPSNFDSPTFLKGMVIYLKSFLIHMVIKELEHFLKLFTWECYTRRSNVKKFTEAGCAKEDFGMYSKYKRIAEEM